MLFKYWRPGHPGEEKWVDHESLSVLASFFVPRVMLLMLHSLQQSSGWIKAHQPVITNCIRTHNRCAVFVVVAQSAQIWDWHDEAPAPGIRCQCQCVIHQCPASPSLSPGRPCSGESNKGVTWDARTRRAPAPQVRAPGHTDIGSKCRNKCQPLSPFTSDGGKQPRVK